jgi:ribulose-phosphate 3-epimerase
VIHQDIRITPSILNADRENLASEISKISSVSDFIHLDVMDNVFVPNFTFDFDAASKIIKQTQIPVDSHLMVADVDQIAIDYAQAGSASVTFHVEACRNIKATAKGIREHGARASIALKPGTAIDVYEDYLEFIDMVLIMTVEPGFGGQKLIPETISKVAAARAALRSKGLSIGIQVDGGVTESNIAQLAEAGADVFVAGSAVFGAENRNLEIAKLRNLAHAH